MSEKIVKKEEKSVVVDGVKKNALNRRDFAEEFQVLLNGLGNKSADEILRDIQAIKSGKVKVYLTKRDKVKEDRIKCRAALSNFFGKMESSDLSGIPDEMLVIVIDKFDLNKVNRVGKVVRLTPADLKGIATKYSNGKY